MRVIPSCLGIDFGTKRMGLAVHVGTIALPHACVARSDATKTIQELVQSRNITHVVIGLPNHIDGRVSDTTRLMRAFVQNELKPNLPQTTQVIEWDERLTSFEAEETLREIGTKKNKPHKNHPTADRDSLAAAAILQHFLDDSSICI